MKFTKSLSAVTAVLFAGSLALTGCSTEGAEKTQEKPTANKFVYNVEVEAPDGAKKPLVANVRSKVELTDETLEKMGKQHGVENVDAKRTLEDEVEFWPEDLGVREDQVRLIGESHNVALIEVDGLSMEKLDDAMLRINVSYTDKGTYLVQMRPMVLRANEELNLTKEVSVTVPEPIAEANVSGRVNGNTVTWTSDNFAEAMEGIEIKPQMNEADGKTLTAETRPTNTDK
ncbi:hypothetical protein MHJ63_04365 [Pseudoglutamicibacter albus]|uniref:hypothetical protein n=1 Tax=Pseudoglutamicibacter albus TaxID=98671 RepID=UPI001EF58AC6|nr:hypothetical protein [Pseudoglutamicibacter albus]MCG7304508.1 hypothetical protein [Pseudoglutamicibacter albus]